MSNELEQRPEGPRPCDALLRVPKHWHRSRRGGPGDGFDRPRPDTWRSEIWDIWDEDDEGTWSAHGLHMVCTWCDYVRPCSTAAGPSFALGFLGPEVSKLDEKWWETLETAMVSQATSHGALERLLVALVVPTSANFRCCIPKVPEVAETRKVQCKLFLSVSFSFLPFLHYKILQSCNAGNCWGTCSCKTIQHGNQKHPKSIITKHLKPE